ncbi:MAG: OsmC family protein [Halioglobus sp.]|nr:OsmC family protein [Halioglobus sp.]
MQDLPHHYSISASAESDGPVVLKGENLPELVTAPPAEFGGPGDRWSPETLLMGAIADCFILTFKAVARASSLAWSNLECSAEGTLERVERVTRFTAVTVRAALTVPAGTDTKKAQRLLEKSESACLITSSMLADTHLETTITVQD